MSRQFLGGKPQQTGKGKDRQRGKYEDDEGRGVGQLRGHRRGNEHQQPVQMAHGRASGRAAQIGVASSMSITGMHSFPLGDVFDYLAPESVKETLEQAILDAPVFGVRWRWNATRALALLRQFGRTFTQRSRKVLSPTNASIFARAARPISRMRVPFVPMRIPFWLSRST